MVQDAADFGRKHGIHRFVINLFQTAVSYAEYILVVGTGLSELISELYWEDGALEMVRNIRTCKCMRSMYTVYT